MFTLHFEFTGIVMMELLQSSCGRVGGVVLWWSHVQDEVLVVELSLLGSSGLLGNVQ